MTRIFPVENWAPTHESRTSLGRFPTFTGSNQDLLSPFSPPAFRTRLRSQPLGLERELAESVHRLSLRPNGEDNAEEGKAGGIRGLLRRASVSLASRKRRHSHAVEEVRPPTAWRRLKQAASFSRSSRFLPPQFEGEGPVDSCEELSSPIPGLAGAPPIIPRGSGGAAARATAAAQNEYFGRHRLLLTADLEDRESGIGIALTTTEPAAYYDTQDDSISRVDFISLLPLELSIQILAHLDHQALVKTSLVCQKWAAISRSQHIWREAFMREQSKTYAMSGPVQLGQGLGLPSFSRDHEWKDLYRIRQQLEQNWRMGRAVPIYLHGHLDSVYCVQFDESKIVTGCRDLTIRVWDLKTYKCTLVIGPPSIVANDEFLVGENGKSVHYATMPDHGLHLESTPNVVSYPIYHTKSILCLQYDSEICVTGSSDHTCIVYDIKDNFRPIRRLSHHTGGVLDVIFDHRYIVTCSKDMTICIWDRATGAMLKQLRGHSGPVNSVQMRGNTIVSCSGDFLVKLWNIDTGKNIREFTGHTKGLACTQFTDDGRIIASAGSDRVIRIWDANTGECLRKIEAHTDLVRSLHIDSVSGRLITGSYDQDIKVFDMETGRALLDFPKWHGSWVLGAKADYRRIVSSGQDRKILVMDFGRGVKGIERLES